MIKIIQEIKLSKGIKLNQTHMRLLAYNWICN